jgi:beta-galactosidase
LKFILSLYGLLLTGFLYAQTASTTNINHDWLFTKENKSAPAKWEPVQLPHTWNTDDVMDDVPGYYRGVGLYKRKLNINKKLKGKQIYLLFEGANQFAEVFINGKKAAEHTGGYSAFTVSITDLIYFDKENELLVKVDNSFNQDIPPLSADFTFYGGLYRDVWLKVVDAVHFSMQENGQYILTPSVNAKSATVEVKTVINNKERISKKVKINTVVRNKNGIVVGSSSQQVVVAAGTTHSSSQPIINIKNPQLWSPESPYLYKVTSEIKDATTGKLLDAITNTLGFRWFHFDAEKGFFLNGKSYKLVGTSRHQDYKGLGNAVPDELALKDILLLKKMGGNFLRVAHYPQDPSVLAACDSLGILTSVEIPVVNEITETLAFYNNCLAMQSEMIRQHYNHPSVIIWCYMNEVLLRPHYNNDKEKQKIYFAAVTKLAKALDSVTRKEDPSRYTMIAHHGDYKRYNETGLNNIAMIVGWNLYSGWYGPNMADFPVFLDTFHKRHPTIPIVVSEYGADADPRIRSTAPVRFDKSVEYTTKLHQYYYTEMMKRPFVAAAMIWNLADFNSETRTESMPHINNKGLLEWDRTAKDPYHYYQAVLSKNPFIKILGASTAAGIADSNNLFCIRQVQVAANIHEVELMINGRSIGKKQTINGLSEWQLPFKNGENVIEVKGERDGKVYHDKKIVSFSLQPHHFSQQVKFEQLNILLGANRYFVDDEKQQWIPDQPYKEGSWGSIGGKTFQIPNSNRLPYGTDKNIAGTNNDPVYQTQQIGIKKYRFDLPAGEYELTLHFAELLGGQIKELPYNLTDPERIEPNGKRIFNVYVNGNLLLDNFDISSQYGSATAVSKKIKLTVTGNTGIEIDFKPVEGEPVLNALQVKKINK